MKSSLPVCPLSSLLLFLYTHLFDPTTHSGLGEWTTIPTTYAGGAKDISDLVLVDRLSNGRVDLTYGSALDIFGGTLVKFDELVEVNKRHAENNASLGLL